MLQCLHCNEESKESLAHVCPACGELTPFLKKESVLHQEEDRCFSCRIKFGLIVRVGLHNVEIVAKRLSKFDILLCNLCYSHTPQPNTQGLEETIDIIMERRLNEPILQYKICKFCSTPFSSTNRKKEFCTNSCRTRAWLQKGGKKIDF